MFTRIQVWWRSSAVTTSREQTVTREGGGGLRWSSDSSKLAFVSWREDHSFIAGLRFLSGRSALSRSKRGSRPGTGVGPMVSRLAFPASLRHIRRGRVWSQARRTAMSIRVAAWRRGAGREVWKAREGPEVSFIFSGGGPANCFGLLMTAWSFLGKVMAGRIFIPCRSAEARQL